MEPPVQDKFSIGMGLVLFLLALVYCFTDYDTTFDINDYVGTYKTAVKYAFTFTFDFLAMVFKIMLVLLFVYVFIVIYNIALVGIFRPLLTKNIDSKEIVSNFSGIDEILSSARISYDFAVMKVAKQAIKIVFGFLDIPNTIVLFFVIIPLYVFFVALAYYLYILNKKNIAKNPSEEQAFLSTNYHNLMILIFTILITFITYILWKTLNVLSSNPESNVVE